MTKQNNTCKNFSHLMLVPEKYIVLRIKQCFKCNRPNQVSPMLHQNLKYGNKIDLLKTIYPWKKKKKKPIKKVWNKNK